MKLILGVLAILFPLSVLAAEPLTFEGEDPSGQLARLTLYDKPCENDAVKAGFAEAIHERLRMSVLVWQGKEYASCYVIAGGVVFSLDETGDRMQPIPLSAFDERGV